MISKFNLLLVTFLFVGKIKYAPGTIASLITCFLFFLVSIYINISIIFLFTLIIFLYSIVAINSIYEKFNSKDPQEIVIDEFVGQMITLLAIPIYETLYPTYKIIYLGASFLTFRFFDILKPYPINYVDKNTKGAFGIMFDDVIAGLFAAAFLIILFFFVGG